MSNYELLSLYTEYAQLIIGGVTVYISFLFAYIVATYYVAGKLTRLQFSFVTILFAGISLHLVSVIGIQGARVLSIQNEITRRIEVDGSEIAFVSALGMPDWFPIALFLFYLLASVIAIVFAARIRRTGT